jgi:hypothetical protein
MQWPERFEERLHIIAHGERFDVDAFLEKSKLRPDFVWRREAPETSGVEFFLGDGRVMSQAEQERIAVEYMKMHHDELLATAGLPGADAFILGLVYIAKLGGGATGAALDWPRELMLKAAEIGITPIHYVTYDFPKQPADEPYACFFLAGHFDPEQLTLRLGISPTETARVGDPIDSRGIRRKNSFWKLRSRLGPSASVDLHVMDVLDQLDKNRVAVEQIGREMEGIVEIVGLSKDYLPPISLDPEVLARIAAYGLRLDVMARSYYDSP